MSRPASQSAPAACSLPHFAYNAAMLLAAALLRRDYYAACEPELFETRSLCCVEALESRA